MTIATEIRRAIGPAVETAASEAHLWRPPQTPSGARPVVVAVDDSSAAESAVRDGVRLAGDLAAPVVFVYVRRGPSAALGDPYYQRRLEAEMPIGNSAIGAALAAASQAGGRPAASSSMGRPDGDSRSSPGYAARA